MITIKRTKTANNSVANSITQANFVKAYTNSREALKVLGKVNIELAARLLTISDKNHNTNQKSFRPIILFTTLPSKPTKANTEIREYIREIASKGSKVNITTITKTASTPISPINKLTRKVAPIKHFTDEIVEITIDLT